MLTKRQNLLETIHGGHPDRFVNQFEYLSFVRSPIASYGYPSQGPGDPEVVNAWGVTRQWPKGVPGGFPVHTPDKIVIKDITHWRDYVKAPATKLDEAIWEPYIAAAEQIDRNETFAAAMVAPGIFEQCHHLGEIQRTLINFYDEPEHMHDLIDFLTDWEIAQAEEIAKHTHPDAVFHHDDWGSQVSTFMSIDMFEEFIQPAYVKIYGAYRELGCELVVHHSDSYAATLAPNMIEMGIDIFQGALDTNNIPELIKKFGGKLSFHGGINTAKVDFEGWTKENSVLQTRKACDECGPLYFIPSTTQGGPGSTYDGVYESVTDAIAEYSPIYWAEHGLN